VAESSSTLDLVERALVHGGVPVAGRATVGAGALTPGVLGGLVGFEAAGDITVLDANHTLASVSKLLISPQRDIPAAHTRQANKQQRVSSRVIEIQISALSLHAFLLLRCSIKQHIFAAQCCCC